MSHTSRGLVLLALLATSVALPACSGGNDAGGGAGGSGGAGGAGGAGGNAADIVMTEADFGCIKDWTQVRLFRITNKLGNLDESLAVANSPGSADYPVGTVIQLIPTEAMVKRKKGFHSASNDWEFFSLEASATGTKILKRGTGDVVNQFGGNCLDCHTKAEPKYDFVCEKAHGCDPLTFTDEQILAVQDGDPRCK